MANCDNISSIIDRRLFTEEDIKLMCKRLGKELTKEYAGKDLLVIGALKGAVFFLTDLVREMDVPLQMDFMDVSSYG
ncbi:MAG: phosphoribosyltransferase family protein, partial [Lactobacillus iners]|nr:phosphoribosyltransferase family protein [Lactobacillus iners]